MKEKDRPQKGEMTHAHWVAAWWARTLNQLTVQAAAGEETVPFDKLLNQPLNCNRIAVEDTVRTAHAYDADLWCDLAEATKRKDKQCDPPQQLLVVDENRRTRARLSAADASLGNRKGAGKSWDIGGKCAGKVYSPGTANQSKGQHNRVPDHAADPSWRNSQNSEGSSGRSLPWMRKKW